MSGWNDWGLKRKLFAIILFILIVNIVVLLFMGSTLIERFYIGNKQTELQRSAEKIRETYEQSSADFYDEIELIENENATVTLFEIDSNGSLAVKYHSRAGKDEMRPWGDKPDMPVPRDDGMERFKKDMLDRLLRADDSYNIRVEAPFGRDDVDGSITLTTRLDDNLYLFMDSPRGYIKSSADLAVKYTAFLSIIILLIGSWLIYLAVDRMTKPIRNIQEVADKISRLDFSQNCPARGSDEIARLATSINNMSDELQSNISRLVEANDVLKSDLERQQQTEQMRRQFIANVSHDFKTPLTLMISYAEALSEQAHGEQAQECCEIIIGEGNKLSAMVGRLLELSRLESGVARAEKSIFCLSEVLDESVRSLRILTEPRGIQVRRCLDEEFIVCADYTKIDQVVTNLFENAAKYAPKGAVVTLRAQRAGVDACRVSVENTGAQIPQEDISSLFDSFYRGDKARSNDGQSYGLGLAIVRGIMDAHGRPYGVENIEGGVRFWFELELADLDDTDDSSGDMPEEGI